MTIFLLLSVILSLSRAAPIPLSTCPLPTLNVPAFGKSLRSLYQLRSNYTNLNHGSYGAVPASVTAVRRCWSDHVEKSPDSWYRYDMYDTINLARDKLSAYINAASPEDVALVDNASHGMNAVLRSLAPKLLAKKGTKILFLQTAYRMVLNTLQFLNDVYNEQLLQVNITTNKVVEMTFDDAVVHAVEEALAKEMAGTVTLCSFSHIVSVPACILPIKRLVQVCRQHGAQVLVDGAHALGHVSIDVQDLDPDYYVANGHKWLYSSKGSALLWVHPNRQADISPTTISYEGQGLSRFQIGFAYQGTQDMTQFMSMEAALSFRSVVSKGSDASIMDYMHTLAVKGGSILAEAWGTEILLPDTNFGAMVDVRLPHNDNVTLLYSLPALILAQYNTWVPIYPWDGQSFSNSSKNWYTRVSAQIYNDETDFHMLANAVLDILGPGNQH